MTTSATLPEEGADGFDRCADAARQGVRRYIQDTLLVHAEGHSEAIHAVIMGSLAGAVEAFVCSCEPSVSRDRMREALRDVADDFAGQAWDELHGGGA